MHEGDLLGEMQNLPCASGCKTKGNFRSPGKQMSQTAAGKRWEEGSADAYPETPLGQLHCGVRTLAPLNDQL